MANHLVLRNVNDSLPSPVREENPFSSFRGTHKYRLNVLLLVCFKLIDFCLPVCRGSHGHITTIRVPSKSMSACFRISLVFMSRWLVGSSNIRRFTVCNNFIMARRVRSPPDNTFIFFMDSFRATKHECPQQVAYLIADFLWQHRR